MKYTMEKDVTDCRDCPARHSSRGQGECWEECSHHDNQMAWHESILWGCREQFQAVPEWCPIKDTE